MKWMEIAMRLWGGASATGPRLLGSRTKIFDGVFEGILDRKADIIVCGEKWDLFCGVVAGAAWPCLIEWRMMGDHATTLRPANGPYLRYT